MRTALKTTLVNLLVLIGLLLAIEIGYRIVKFSASCMSDECDRSYWQVGTKFRIPHPMGIRRQDPVIGSVPNDGDYSVPWPDGLPTPVTIRNSVRLNGPQHPSLEGDKTLAVGDSFTFGDEVADSDTWPACLEREWNSPVINAGMFGYGAAQAVLRARQLEVHGKYDRVIWSILVGNDFERDTLVARSSDVRPAVITTPQGPRYTSVEESQRVLDAATHRGIAKYAGLFGYLYITKLAWEHLSRSVLPEGMRFDGLWTVPHPQAAPRPELMAFAFDQFAALSAAEKYVLLQYPKKSLVHIAPADAAELRAIRKLAAKRNIAIIDTLPVLRSAPDRTALYRTHHTPAGNRTVCRSIVTAVGMSRRQSGQ